MSTTQASQIVGSINSITSTLDTAAEVYADIEDSNCLPPAFGEVAKKFELITNFLRIAKQHIRKSLDEESCNEIGPIMERCKDKASRLESLFHQVIPQPNILRFECYRQAVNKLGRGNRVEILMREMLEDVKSLAMNQAIQATTTEVEELNKAIEEVSAILPSLSDDIPGNSINNYGSGTINANTGGGTQNNNNANGKLFVGEKQYFGKEHGD